VAATADAVLSMAAATEIAATAAAN